jgi:hypothetical protein
MEIEKEAHSVGKSLRTSRWTFHKADYRKSEMLSNTSFVLVSSTPTTTTAANFLLSPPPLTTTTTTIIVAAAAAAITYLLTPWSRVLLEKLTSELCS